VQPAQVFETFEQVEQSPVPLIAGYNSGEMLAQDLAILPPLPETQADFVSHVRQAYGDAADQFLALYPAALPRQSAYASIGDADYGWATEKLLRLHGAVTDRTWMYQFDHVYASAAARHLGAFHASDISFTFGNIGTGVAVPRNWPPPPQGPLDVRMSDAMMDLFVAFARDASPGPTWPRYDAARSWHVVFRDGEAQPAERFKPGMFAVHDEHIARLRREDVSWDWGNVGIAAPPHM
jgi:para-nitrobenzyl esterase